MDSDKPSILYVDDYEEGRIMLKILLNKAGFAPLTAGTVAEAMAIIEKTRLDVCILSIMLPDGNGIELCQQIHQRQPYVRFIYYTSLAQAEERALEQCGDLFLRKPASFEDIEAAVNKLLLKTSD